MLTLDLCAEVCEDHRLGNMSTEWKYVNKGDSNTILSSIYLKTRFLKLELYYIHVYTCTFANTSNLKWVIEIHYPLDI